MLKNYFYFVVNVFDTTFVEPSTAHLSEKSTLYHSLNSRYISQKKDLLNVVLMVNVKEHIIFYE